MNDEAALRDKLRKIETLFAAAATAGEKAAAGAAADRIRARLREEEKREKSVEIRFSLPHPIRTPRGSQLSWLRAGTLLVTALLVILGFVLVVRPMLRDGLPGDYETRQGDIQLSAGDFDAALPRFDAALAISPGHRGALMGRAIVLMQTGKSAEADAAFGVLIDQLVATTAADDRTGQGALAAAYANRGILRDRAGRYEDALADYRQSLRIDREAVAGPALIDRVLQGDPRPSTVAKRAAYLEEQLRLPEAERRLRLPEADDRQRMYKP